MGMEAMATDPFEALSDSHRRAIVELLATGGHSVQELADRLPISRPAVSRHLRRLKEAGLVTSESEGTRRIYALDLDGVESLRNYVDTVWGEAVARPIGEEPHS
jgi:DNA-binding transcriptional ArsR family regulator